MEELFEFDLSDVDVAAFESVVTPATEPRESVIETSKQIDHIPAQIQTNAEEQISVRIEEQHNNHYHETHHPLEQSQDDNHGSLSQHDTQPLNNQMHDRLQSLAQPSSQQQSTNQTIQIQLQQKHQLTASQQIQLQQQLQHHQFTSATNQQPCKILLIPINSTKPGTPGLKAPDCFIPGLKNLIQLPQGAPPLTLGALKSTVPTATSSGSNINSYSTSTISNHTNNSSKRQHNNQFPPPPVPPSLPQAVTSSPTTIADEVPKRKPCNCTKSQCLKLYCDCFANGEFCSGCNCKDCFNSLSREKERQKAITQCLERNPEAFRPKIGKAIKGASVGEPAPESIERRHTKGCNCKRSGCLKNYCECYEAKILCSNLCKCCGCKNYEESFERKTLMQLANSSADSARGILKNLLPLNSGTNNTSTTITNNHHLSLSSLRQGSAITSKNFINSEVIQASLMCLLQSAQQAEQDGVPSDEIPNLIQTEMGRCLRMIVNSIANESLEPTNSRKRWNWDRTR